MSNLSPLPHTIIINLEVKPLQLDIDHQTCMYIYVRISRISVRGLLERNQRGFTYSNAGGDPILSPTHELTVIPINKHLFLSWCCW